MRSVAKRIGRLLLAVLAVAGCASALRQPPPIHEMTKQGRVGSPEEVAGLLARAEELFSRRDLWAVREAAEIFLAAVAADSTRTEGRGGAAQDLHSQMAPAAQPTAGARFVDRGERPCDPDRWGSSEEEPCGTRTRRGPSWRRCGTDLRVWRHRPNASWRRLATGWCRTPGCCNCPSGARPTSAAWWTCSTNRR